MTFDTATLEIVIGFMVLANRLTAALITPLFEHYSWDKFGIMYISWAIAGVFVWLSGANLFASLIPNVLIGQILTAVVAGGGGNLLHDISDQKSTILIAEVPEDTAVEDLEP